MATAAASRRPWRRRATIWLHQRPRLRLALLLGAPLGWMLVVYLGALTFLLVAAFWRLDPFTALIQKQWGFQNFKILADDPVYRTIALRTVGIALAVTVIDVVLAFPLAYFAARLAKPRVRTALLLSIVLPLWASYLVRVYAWRVILSGDGLMNWTLQRLHLGSLHLGFTNWAILIVFCYLWLPFVVLPIYAALERIPESLVEASADLGARWWTTFRRVIFPIVFPGIVAGSIFSFSLTLGDYIVPQLVGNTFFIGNVVDQSVGVSNNVPFGAAFAIVPVVIMAIYLAMARKMGAFDAL